MTTPLTALLARWTCALALAAGMLGLAAASAHAQARVPELVSNTDTNGSDVKDLLRPSADGHSMAWFALAAYANPKGANANGVYVGRRTPDGWKVSPYWPDTSLVRAGTNALIGGYMFSSDLSVMFAPTFAAFDPADVDYTFGSTTIADVYRFDASGRVTWVSRPQGVPAGLNAADIVGLSEDGSTVFFTSADPMTPEVPVGMVQLYRWRDGNIEVVGRDTTDALLPTLQQGSSIQGPALGNGTSATLASGGGQGGQLADSSAVSSDGSRFVYREAGEVTLPHRVFLHEDGVGDREISLSQRAGSIGQRAPTGATLVATTPELHKIFLQSLDQLTDDAPVGGGDYVYDTETRQLSFSNVDSSVAEGGGSRSGIVKVSDDGQYVYFQSRAVLTPGAEADGRNLYLKHGTDTRLIAVLASTDKDDALGVRPTDGGIGVPYPAYSRSGLSADGTRLVFLSSASLAGFTAGGYLSVYVFDAASNTLTCVSCRSDGSAPEGDASFSTENDGYLVHTPRAISADGDTVAFGTTDGLVPADTNGRSDVYEAKNGHVSLISGGTSRFGSTFGGLSPDGVDLYFETRDSLSPEDANNGFTDLYDARIGGRVAPGVQPGVVCSGDDCQGPAPPRVQLASPGSKDFAGADTAPPAEVAGLRVRKGTSSSNLVTVKVDAPGAGEIQAGGKGLTATNRTATRATTYTIKLKLTAGSRRTLQKKGRLAVRVQVRFVPVQGKAVVKTANVTIKRSARSSRKGR